MKQHIIAHRRRFNILSCLIVLIGIITLAGANSSAAQRPTAISKMNLSGFGDVPELIYYRFNTAGASVANEASAPVGTNPAPLLGSLIIGSTGQFGTGLLGSGNSSTTDYVNTGWAPNLGTGSWTISLWISQASGSSTLFYYFGDSNSTSFRAFTNGVAGAGNLLLRGAGLNDVLVTGGSSTSAPSAVHFVYDSIDKKVYAYLNGSLVNTVNQTGTPNLTGTGPFKVSGYSTNVGLASGQSMDEFRLYNRALTAAEVAATWNKTLPLSSEVSKTVSPGSAKPGDPITYTVRISNTTGVNIPTLLITDTLSPNMLNPNYSSSGISLTQSLGAPYAWSATNVLSNSIGIITITATLASPLASGVFTNTVLLSANSITRTASAPITIQNIAPIANAGPNQQVDVAQLVTLDGSGSTDANGDSLNYSWDQIAGPDVTLSSLSTVSPTFTAPTTDTMLVFIVRVTDTLGLTSSRADIVLVTVTERLPGYTSNPLPGSTLSFSDVQIGTSQSTNLAISETGNATLTSAAISISGAHASDFSVTPASFSLIDGAAAEQLTIQCTPGAAGTRTATLTITHNGAQSPATYTLNCEATNPPVVPTTTAIYLPVAVK
jgi:uncharacterized repeat protein (TIGR01451 family)